MSVDPPCRWVVLGGIPVRGIVVVIIIGGIVLLGLNNESYSRFDPNQGVPGTWFEQKRKPLRLGSNWFVQPVACKPTSSRFGSWTFFLLLISAAGSSLSLCPRVLFIIHRATVFVIWTTMPESHCTAEYCTCSKFEANQWKKTRCTNCMHSEKEHHISSPNETQDREQKAVPKPNPNKNNPILGSSGSIIEWG